MRARLAVVALAAVVVVVPLAACGGDSEPGGSEEGSGQSIYSDNCARCHGPDGEGGVGPALGDGAVAETYPDIADQIAVIRDGRNGMPSWEGELTPDEIEAVATYEREQLGQ